MTAPLFTPPRPPSERTTTTRKPRTVETPFGDGYRQRSVDGLNADLTKATLIWTGLGREDALAIEDFLRARQGVEPFRWTAPWEAVERLWLATGWRRSFDRPTALFEIDIEEVPA